MAMREPTTVVASLGAGRVEYRLERSGERAVVVLHGGHMRASLRLGEDELADLGCTVLAPSRPGYGATPSTTGGSPEGFADAVRDLCGQLGISAVTAVVGISAGGPTAVALAARHPDLVERVILVSAVGALPWPDRRSRVAAAVAFNPVSERGTWAAVRALLRVAPNAGLRALLAGLSTRSGASVVASLSTGERTALVELFSQLRSSRGFQNDLRHLRAASALHPQVTQPSLVVASRHDGAVAFAHAESLLASLPHAQLFVSDAESHFVWFGCDRPALSDAIRSFLADGQRSNA